MVYEKKGGVMVIKKTSTEKTDLTDRIRAKAKELWEKDGRKQGRDLDYWLQAERIIKSETKR